ncbi:hypothetical protein [Clostridium sp. Cult2]|uniref:hypothetical protein n=1 Tax=Clostridium sp. Cult2 TaxID=2079003 RepID=UPI001F3172E6|nr:hypothetical protein [Clostridium sp. Cult2]MCF6464751.1 hypothetical protein [Clostridium sp. Cult2]
MSSNTFELTLRAASSLPMVYIDREKFLYKELIKYYPKEQVEIAIKNNPAYAGIQVSMINKIARHCINYETNKVSSISFAAGLPGGFAMAGTIPADITQYFGHVLRILQKLIYLYGWEELVSDDEPFDDETKNLLTLFIGVMFGVNGAATTITKISASAAQKASKSLASKALTKGTIYPMVKKIAQVIGVKMTKEVFAKSVSKVIPVVGGIASGGLTYATYKPMSYRLKRYLENLKWCDPEYYNSTLT